MQKTEALRWTPHMNECLQVLEQNPESFNDEVLVQQVRLQLILQKMALNTWFEETIDAAEDTRAPALFHVQRLQAQLQQVKTTFSPQIQRNGKFKWAL